MKRLVLMLSIFILLAGCGESAPETQNSFPCIVIGKKETSPGGRDRLFVDIIPEGTPELNRQSLGDSVIRSALALEEIARADVYILHLHQDEGVYRDELFTPLALCTYVPDGKGIGGDGDLTWDVQAAEEPVPDNIIRVARYWRAERSKFLERKEWEVNGQTMVDEEYLNEDALTAHLSKMLGIPEDEVMIYHLKAVASEYYRK